MRVGNQLGEWMGWIKAVWPVLALGVQAVFLAGGWWMLRKVRAQRREKFRAEADGRLERQEEEAAATVRRVTRLETRLERLEWEVNRIREDVDENASWISLTTREVVQRLGLGLDVPDPNRESP